MARTVYVEMHNGERWQDVAGAFLQWWIQRGQVASGGCHEGDAGGPADGRRYAAISVPDHNLTLADNLREWAALEGRRVG
jgi:hypothetical protein